MNRQRTGQLCILMLTLLLSVGLAPFAAASQYHDLPETHWAYTHMTNAAELGIVSGVGGDRMNPSGALTWGQYLTMAARTFAPEEYATAITGGAAWDVAGEITAQQTGLLHPQDKLPIHLASPITRQDAAVLLCHALEGSRAYPYSSINGATRFSDWGQMDALHQRAAGVLVGAGIVSGKGDGTFAPNDTMLRSDGSALLLRTLALVDENLTGVERTVTLRTINAHSGQTIVPDRMVTACVGDPLADLVDAPEGYLPLPSQSLTTISSAGNCYALYYRPMTAAELPQQPTQHPPTPQPPATDPMLRVLGENGSKSLLLFGDEAKRRFSNREEAEANVSAITVPIWTLVGDTKVPSTITLTVHTALTADVTAIFTEIYNDSEQFPFRDAGGYSWRGDSATGEHNCGTAIDLNYDANYQVRDGVAMAGSLWLPGQNPYSIPADGSVVRIFAAHGWAWGGDAWADSSDSATGYHDYMHFSYMGR